MKKIIISTMFLASLLFLSIQSAYAQPIEASAVEIPVNNKSDASESTYETDTVSELNERYVLDIPTIAEQSSGEKYVVNTQQYEDKYVDEELVLYSDGTYDIAGVDYSESSIISINPNAGWSGSSATCKGDLYYSTCINARAYGRSFDLELQMYFDYTTSRSGKSSITKYYNPSAKKITSCWLSSKSTYRISESPSNPYKDTVVYSQNITGSIQQKSNHKLQITINNNNISVVKSAS